MQNFESVAIIPARGGSKRIPNKNICDFLGRPIIAYPIDTCIKSNLFDRVIVSTDSPQIADVAREFKAEVPFLRTLENASDTATTVAVVLEVIARYKEKFASCPEFVCCIYPTAVFVTQALLKESLALLRADPQLDAVVPMVPHPHAIERAFQIKEGRASMINPAHMHTRSQDLRESYYDPGQFYMLRVSSLLEQGRLFMDRTAPIIISEMASQDINTLEDWVLAEMKYRVWQERRGGNV